MRSRESLTVSRILRFSLTSADADGLSGFYERAFGFRRMSERREAGTGFERSGSVAGGATIVTLQLGGEQVEIVHYDIAGAPYPAHALASDLTFQHLALVVADMQAAFERLSVLPGWTPISSSTPQRLPQSSGNVTAFKFRDPEGHPLELLAFAAHNTPIQWQTTAHSQLFMGIDHSAISIRDTARSLAFYRQLGFHVDAQTLNEGPEQQRLDGLPEAQVAVTALRSAPTGPHLELLCYRSPRAAGAVEMGNNDIAATRTVLATGPVRHMGGGPVAGERLRDPDGHRLQLFGSAPKNDGARAA